MQIKTGGYRPLAVKGINRESEEKAILAFVYTIKNAPVKTDWGG